MVGSRENFGSSHRQVGRYGGDGFPAKKLIAPTKYVISGWHWAGAQVAWRGLGGNWVLCVQWCSTQGQGSARGGDEGAPKSTNKQGAPEVDRACPLGVGGGEAGFAESSGVLFNFGAVPGAEIWHFKKMYTQESFFVRLVSSIVSCLALLQFLL